MKQLTCIIQYMWIGLRSSLFLKTPFLLHSPWLFIQRCTRLFNVLDGVLCIQSIHIVFTIAIEGFKITRNKLVAQLIIFMDPILHLEGKRDSWTIATILLTKLLTGTRTHVPLHAHGGVLNLYSPLQSLGSRYLTIINHVGFRYVFLSLYFNIFILLHTFAVFYFSWLLIFMLIGVLCYGIFPFLELLIKMQEGVKCLNQVFNLVPRQNVTNSLPTVFR